MPTKLNQTQSSDGDDLFYDLKFLNTLEYLLPYLILNVGNSTLNLSQIDNIQSKYDFYRILAKKTTSLPRCYWWITMRMNGYVQSSDYLGDRTSIIVPDLNYLNTLATNYKTINPVS